ncbi:glycosyltransferase family 4 protein [Rhizobium sp. ARZ01]|uniref:glycosyltransferase family 4 protein n=1 Tax=Rhizobium sp. ARZ01 TaxID=2769313 RepID=UPI00178067BE|nr:glycosyltransferase family 4 protein [Rhizobium sp. ARZ01]MBD9374409.1 glycosyltransferase family 4 protein [Rhizobium sp. ARZ01]
MAASTLGSTLSSVRLQIDRRARQISRLLATQGYRTVVDRARLKVSEWIKPRSFAWDVFPDDVTSADLIRPALPSSPNIAASEPMVINWVMGPAGPGSGGHTTISRVLNYLQDKGHTNRVYFYDPYCGDHKYYEMLAREHYGMTCEIGNARAGMSDAHAVLATGWPSAYGVYNARCAGKRFYFIQDYEPYFYPVGTNSVLAENTYRMGFHGITAGRWLADKLAREFGMDTDYFPFGCDTTRYRRDPSTERSGVVFYARLGTPRRAVELGLLALELFAKRQPQIEVHIFGNDFGDLPFKFTNHGLVSPDKLNEIYNTCFAGLTLSLTNVSLVPYEMLASGCIPIVNDADHNRVVLDNPSVRYASLTPHSLAAALEDVICARDFESVSREAATSVASRSWDTAGATVEKALRRALMANNQFRPRHSA